MADLETTSGRAAAQRGWPVDLAVSGALVLLAAAAVTAGAPAPLRLGALTAAGLALAVTSGRRAMWRAPEKLVVALGGALAGLVLLGTVLGLSVGVSRQAWGVVLLLVGAAVLLVAARRPVVSRMPRLRLGTAAWVVAAVVVASGGLAVAVRGAQLDDTPPLQMWIDQTDPGQVAVELRAPGPSGPYDLWLEPDGGQPVLVSSGLNLPGDEAVRVVLPGDGGQRAQVVLRAPGSAEAVRSVLVDRT